MADDSVGLLIVKMAFPAMAGMVVYSLLSLVDTFFVAKLGPESLAALTFCIPIEILLVSMASATGVGITSLISRTLGKGKRSLADNIAWHGLLLCLGYGLVFPSLGLKYISKLLQLFGCGPDLFGLSHDFLGVILIGSLFIFIPIISGSIVQGEGNLILPTLTSIAGIFLNVVFDPLFIFGLGPVQAMGLRGAAIATILSQLIASLMILIIMFKKPAYLSWRLSSFRLSAGVIAGIYRVGFPTLVMEIVNVFIIIILNKILAGFTYTGVAALGVFMKIRSFFYMPINGLAQGAMPIAGFAYGARNYDRVKETIIKASVLATIILLFAWYLMQYHSLLIMNIFSSNPALTFIGVNCMKMATIFLPFVGPIIILYTVLQATGRGTTAMYLSIIRQFGIFLPAILILPRYYELNGVWLAFSVFEAMSALIALVFFMRLWKELQERKYTIFLCRWGYFLQRFSSWLKW